MIVITSPTANIGHQLTGSGMSGAMVQAIVAKNDGLDNAESRTPENSTPTTLRQWCEDVLKPAVTS